METDDAILETLRAAVLAGDVDRAVEAARRALEAGLPPIHAIEQGLNPGIREVGERFNRLEVFLPEMVLSAKAMEAAVGVLEPHLGEASRQKKGNVLIGTVKGDIHDIGKNIAIALLKVNGYQVEDLGKDVSSSDFVDRAVKSGAQLVGLSGLLTTSLPMMREVIQIMEEDGVRHRFKVIIGGGPTSQEYAREIGADGYAETAQDGVVLCDRLLALE
jgi:corrinoid protein of di/trimethylamine methyltransferase